MLLGVMAMAALMIMDLIFAEVRGQEDSLVRPMMIQKNLVWLTGLALACVVVTLSLYFFQISSLSRGDETVRTSMRLLMELYQPLFGMRLGLMLAGVGWLAYSVYRMLSRERKIQELLTPIYLSCLMVMIGEILGRFLFYATHIRLGI
jgi:hypothetical protein